MFSDRKKIQVHRSERLPFLLEILNHVVLEKHSGGATRHRKTFDDIFIRFDTIPACNRRVAAAIAALSYASREQQEAQLMLTNPRDQFRGQSRSPNIVPFTFHIVSSCAVVTLSLRRAGFPIFDFRNAVTLTTGLRVRQCHWKCHHAIQRIRLPIDVLQ